MRARSHIGIMVVGLSRLPMDEFGNFVSRGSWCETMNDNSVGLIHHTTTGFKRSRMLLATLGNMLFSSELLVVSIMKKAEQALHDKHTA